MASGMKRLIDEPVFTQAFGFGLRSMGKLLREHAVLYIIIGVVLSAFVAWTSLGAKNIQYNPGVFLTYPALAAAMRLAKPEYRMRVTSVLALTMMGLLIFSPVIVITAFTVAVAITKGMNTFSLPGFVAFCFILFAFVYIWVMIKFSLCWIFYAADEEQRPAFIQPMVESWNFVEGDMWWRVVGLGLAIGLTCELVPSIFAAYVLLGMGGGNSYAGLFVWALIVYAATVPATVWLQAAYVALVSTRNSRTAAGLAVATES